MDTFITQCWIIPILLYTGIDLLLLLRVFSPQESIQQDRRTHRHQVHAQTHRLAPDIARRILGQVDLSRHDTTGVAKGLVHPDGNGALVPALDVAADPGDVETREEVHPRGTEETGQVIHAGRRARDQDDVAHDGEDTGPEHVGRPLVVVSPVHEQDDDEVDQSPPDVDGDSKVLDFEGRIAHALNDSWQESGES
jgi:hypothetical protein